MSLFKKKSHFDSSLAVFRAKGFCDEYIAALKEDISKIKGGAELNKGRSYLCNALIFQGKLHEALEIFNEVNLKRLDKTLSPNLSHNIIFALFALDRFSEAEELYANYNAIVLSTHTSSMKRTLAIHEHINKRYENAVTVLVKLRGEELRFWDICLIKTMLALDMFERAAEISHSLKNYKNLSELSEIAANLKNQIKKRES